MNKEVVFIVEPHMDDGILGCTGYILSNPKNKYYLITVSYHTDNEIRLKETLRAVGKLKKLKINITHIQLDGKYRDNKLDTYSYSDILSELEKLSYDLTPDTLFLPYPSSHQDHRLVYEIGISLSRIDYKHFISNVYLYEPYLSSWSPIRIDYGKFYVPLTRDESISKLEIIGSYESQIDNFKFKLYSMDSILEFMKLRGRECSQEYAEAFYVMREVTK